MQGTKKRAWQPWACYIAPTRRSHHALACRAPRNARAPRVASERAQSGQLHPDGRMVTRQPIRSSFNPADRRPKPIRNRFKTTGDKPERIDCRIVEQISSMISQRPTTARLITVSWNQISCQAEVGLAKQFPNNLPNSVPSSDHPRTGQGDPKKRLERAGNSQLCVAPRPLALDFNRSSAGAMR